MHEGKIATIALVLSWLAGSARISVGLCLACERRSIVIDYFRTAFEGLVDRATAHDLPKALLLISIKGPSSLISRVNRSLAPDPS
jgi:hypothetical protein